MLLYVCECPSNYAQNNYIIVSKYYIPEYYVYRVLYYRQRNNNLCLITVLLFGLGNEPKKKHSAIYYVMLFLFI